MILQKSILYFILFYFNLGSVNLIWGIIAWTVEWKDEYFYIVFPQTDIFIC